LYKGSSSGLEKVLQTTQKHDHLYVKSKVLERREEEDKESAGEAVSFLLPAPLIDTLERSARYRAKAL
jgi:hypothetical protein